MINKEKNFISAVIYIHNNEKDIKNFFNGLYSVLNKKFETFEIIFVNDCSKDNSLNLIKELAKTVDSCIINIVNMSYYQGIETAIKAGVDIAIGDFVYEFDNVCLDYDINLISDVYNQSLKGFDIVCATSKNKKLSSKIFYSIFNRFSKSQYEIDSESFRILSRRAINRINMISTTIPYRKAIYSNCGLKLYRFEYKPINNIKSQNVNSNRIGLAIDSLIIFTDFAYKLSLFLSGISLLSSISISLYALLMFFNKTAITGWTTTILFIATGFVGVFLLLTISLKYLSIIMNLIIKKQKYIIESIDKISNK